MEILPLEANFGVMHCHVQHASATEHTTQRLTKPCTKDGQEMHQASNTLWHSEHQ